MSGQPITQERLIQIGVDEITLEGNLSLPPEPAGVVLFAHGSGSSRHSPRNQFVARQLNEGGLATLLIDLLSAAEDVVDQRTRRLRFDIDLLAGRLVGATDWLAKEPATRPLPLGYFGASTGAAAALVAATQRPDRARAVVSRGGRPDLAGEQLGAVCAPTLLIVGGDDAVVIQLNESALERLGASQKQIVIVPGAGHLFEEPGALEEVARLAKEWFHKHLGSDSLREPAEKGVRPPGH